MTLNALTDQNMRKKLKDYILGWPEDFAKKVQVEARSDGLFVSLREMGNYMANAIDNFLAPQIYTLERVSRKRTDNGIVSDYIIARRNLSEESK